MLQVGDQSFSKDESHWKEGGYLEEGKVKVTSSYDYWSIKSEEDVSLVQKIYWSNLRSRMKKFRIFKKK